jgi:hypothetical protein
LRAVWARHETETRTGRKEVARFAMLREAMIAQKKDYWVKQLDVQVQAVSAWIGRAEDRDNEALQGMRAAAAVEEQTEKHIMMPGSVMPSLSLRSRCCRGRPATGDAPRSPLGPEGNVSRRA